MLSRRRRLRSSVDFARAVRGSRAGSGALVAHLVLDPGSLSASDHSPVQPARAGLVVSRRVGDAVTRNRVKRRLRHLLDARLDALPSGSLLVVRAQPAAAEASWDELGVWLDRCLERVTGPAARAQMAQPGRREMGAVR